MANGKAQKLFKLLPIFILTSGMTRSRRVASLAYILFTMRMEGFKALL